MGERASVTDAAHARGSSLLPSSVTKAANCNNNSLLLLSHACADMSKTSAAARIASTTTASKLMTNRESPESLADYATLPSFPLSSSTSRGHPLLRHPLPIFPSSVSSQSATAAANTCYPYGGNLFHCFMANATRNGHRFASGSNFDPSLRTWDSSGVTSAFTPLRRPSPSGLIWNPVAARSASPVQSSSATAKSATTSSSASKEVKWNEQLMSQLPLGLGHLMQQQQEARYGGGGPGYSSSNNSSSRSWQLASSLILSHLRSLSMNQT